MPTFYHGTGRAIAVALVGPVGGPGTVNVALGGGEFGRGFYTQESKSNAHSRAQNSPVHHATACVFEVDIDNQSYNQLKCRKLKPKKANTLRQQLASNKTKHTYVAGVDVIVGPLKSHPHIEQQKFESPTAANLLNGPNTQRRII